MPVCRRDGLRRNPRRHRWRAGNRGWRDPFAPIAVILALVAVAYVGWNRDPYRLGRTDVQLVATVRRLATTRAQREALLAFALFHFVVGALAGVVLASSVSVIAATIAVYAIGYKTVFPVADALLLDAAPDENVGGDLRAARAVLIGVGALGPVYMGGLADIASFEFAFVGLGTCLVVAAALLLRGLRDD